MLSGRLVGRVNKATMREALLILFGFALNALPKWFDRKRTLRTHWAAVRAEVELCRERATALLGDQVQSPLYRLPLHAYEASFTVLLGEGAVSESEVLNVERFYAQAQTSIADSITPLRCCNQTT